MFSVRQFLKTFVTLWLLLLLCTQGFGVILPAVRRINWDPGVRGGIINRSTVYTNLPAGSTAATIQNALNYCPSNQIVQLDAGNYELNARLQIPSYVTLRGAGVSNTVLSARPGDSTISRSMVLMDGGYDYDWNAVGGRSTSATTNAVDILPTVKGSGYVTSTVPHGISLNAIVIIDSMTNAASVPPVSNKGSIGTASWVGRPDTQGNQVDGINVGGQRPMGQYGKVTNIVSSTVFEVDPPAYWTYTNSPQAFVATGFTEFAGLEHLTLDNSYVNPDTNDGVAQDIMTLQGAMNCWVQYVEFRGVKRRAIWGYGAFWCSIYRCFFWDPVPYAEDNGSPYRSDRAYGPFLGPHMTACLFEDCVMRRLTLGWAMEGCAWGNVFSACVILDIYWNQLSDYPRRFGPLMHGPHPGMNLTEFTWSSDRVRADEYWGTGQHWVFHRCVLMQTDRGSPRSQTWTIDIERKNDYYSFIGCLIGGTVDGYGVNENNYEYINGEPAPYDDLTKETIWKIGYKVLGNDGTLYSTDTLNSILRWGNWCYRTNDTIAGSGITYHDDNVQDTADFTIPTSYFRVVRPVEWGTLSWPPYDPLVPTSRSMANVPAGFYIQNGYWPPVRVQGQSATGPAKPSGKRTVNSANPVAE